MIRVGFVIAFEDSWIGGINYFRNLFSALYEFPERKIEVVIITGFQSPANQFDDFPSVKIVHSRLFDRGSLPWFMRKLWQRVFLHDLLLEQLLKRHNILILSHARWIGAGMTIPAIGWIPDFQHVHLPEFFDKKEIALRDRVFRDLCRHCTRLIVSSFNAQSDLANYLPECKSKSEVLQFVVPSIYPTLLLPSRNDLEVRYEFTGNYLLLPSQFWRHKNHRVAIEALGLLRKDGKRVLILATGSTEDYRNPQFFDSLMAHAKELDVLHDFRPLGFVRAHDLAALMLHASAIINPSCFEGWSTTVEEAKSLGKRIVVSDIDVHREQNPSRAIYFPPNNAEALAASLWKVWNEPEANETLEIEKAHITTNERRLAFANKYQQIVLKIVENNYL